jgi:hypothetical protein
MGLVLPKNVLIQRVPAHSVAGLKSCLQKTLRLGLLVVGVLANFCWPASLQAQEIASLQSIYLNGQPSNAIFAVGLTSDRGKTYRDTALLGEEVTIEARLTPEPQHAGKKADIFVVQQTDTTMMLRLSSGKYLPWDGKLSTLLPAQSAVTLKPEVQQEIFKGKLNVAGEKRIYLGYRLVDEKDLIFTPIPWAMKTERDTNSYRAFEQDIEKPIIQSKCIGCHQQGGIAEGRTTLIFAKDAAVAEGNYDALLSVVLSKANAYDYVLSKVTGGDRHVGGAPLAKNSSDYQKLEHFLGLITGVEARELKAMSPEYFYQGIQLQSNEQTLRQAAIRLVGRLPTEQELRSLTADDSTLRAAIQNLLQGENFHEFLKDAANDQLLLRGLSTNVLQECQNCFPNYTNKVYELEKSAVKTGKRAALWAYDEQIRFGIEESPLELIAHIVENDKPYSEVLTASYMMMNQALHEALGGNAKFASKSPTDFQPGTFLNYYRQDKSVVTKLETATNYWVLLDPGQLRTSYPLSGVLNSFAFLARYPSTATNRNRARARWTFQHFLGVDIEQQAQRTTDANALADTNNPTLKNPNCTACHALLDPLAGAFQDYGDAGFYKESWGGMDALDALYKSPKVGTTLYRAGDTWYRDMRAPGFKQQAADGKDSLRWLAEHLVQDDRFNDAAVRFWWPAVIGSELLARPEVATDADYAARLFAYEAQQAEVERLSKRFATAGQRVKSLIVDLVMSAWFRAEAQASQTAIPLQREAQALADFGNEALLTPEQLARKTYALTGFNWGGQRNLNLNATTAALQRDYGLIYGGIDSSAITHRARELTPLMSTVAMTMALESSCPIVFGEFAIEDNKRHLFAGLSPVVTPLTEAAQTVTITSGDINQFSSYSLAAEINIGTKLLTIDFINDYCEVDAQKKYCLTDRNVMIDRVMVQRPNGSVQQIMGKELELAGSNCGAASGQQMMLWSNCTATLRFFADQPGTYKIYATLAASRSGNELAQTNIALSAVGPALHSAAKGAQLIKQKLVDLHQSMLGKKVALNSPDIQAAYQLLVETWESKLLAKGPKNLFQSDQACFFGNDINFLDSLGYPGEATVIKTNNTGYQWEEYANWNELGPWLAAKGADPTYMKQSWPVVISYLMMHYNYLYE